MAESLSINPESSLHRVWVGIGRAVESQSPKAWEKRILNVIDTHIIPKLDAGDRQWAAELRPSVEKFAKIGGVTVTATECALAAIAGVKIYKKFTRAPLPKPAETVAQTLVEPVKRHGMLRPRHIHQATEAMMMKRQHLPADVRAEVQQFQKAVNLLYPPSRKNLDVLRGSTTRRPNLRLVKEFVRVIQAPVGPSMDQELRELAASMPKGGPPHAGADAIRQAIADSMIHFSSDLTPEKARQFRNAWRASGFIGVPSVTPEGLTGFLDRHGWPRFAAPEVQQLFDALWGKVGFSGAPPVGDVLTIEKAFRDATPEAQKHMNLAVAAERQLHHQNINIPMLGFIGHDRLRDATTDIPQVIAGLQKLEGAFVGAGSTGDVMYRRVALESAVRGVWFHRNNQTVHALAQEIATTPGQPQERLVRALLRELDRLPTESGKKTLLLYGKAPRGDQIDAIVRYWKTKRFAGLDEVVRLPVIDAGEGRMSRLVRSIKNIAVRAVNRIT